MLFKTLLYLEQDDIRPMITIIRKGIRKFIKRAKINFLSQTKGFKINDVPLIKTQKTLCGGLLESLWEDIITSYGGSGVEQEPYLVLHLQNLLASGQQY